MNIDGIKMFPAIPPGEFFLKKVYIKKRNDEH